MDLQQLTYSLEMIVYRIEQPSDEVIAKLRAFVGTQSLMPLPTFSLTAQYLPVGVMNDQSFPPPIELFHVPVSPRLFHVVDRVSRSCQSPKCATTAVTAVDKCHIGNSRDKR